MPREPRRCCNQQMLLGGRREAVSQGSQAKANPPEGGGEQRASSRVSFVLGLTRGLLPQHPFFSGVRVI